MAALNSLTETQSPERVSLSCDAGKGQPVSTLGKQSNDYFTEHFSSGARYWLYLRYCPTPVFDTYINQYRPILINADMCCCGMNTLWLICIVMWRPTQCCQLSTSYFCKKYRPSGFSFHLAADYIEDFHSDFSPQWLIIYRHPKLESRPPPAHSRSQEPGMTVHPPPPFFWHR